MTTHILSASVAVFCNRIINVSHSCAAKAHYCRLCYHSYQLPYCYICNKCNARYCILHYIMHTYIFSYCSQRHLKINCLTTWITIDLQYEASISKAYSKLISLNLHSHILKVSKGNDNKNFTSFAVHYMNSIAQRQLSKHITIDLSWNWIQHYGAKVVANALHDNKYLSYLGAFSYRYKQ